MPVLVILGLAGGVAMLLWPSPLSGRAVVLKFLTYTNNVGSIRVAFFEITNESAGHIEWSLHADGRSRDHRVAVTDLMETNGELRHIGSGGPLNLFSHDSLRFATDVLYPGENVWVEIRPYPLTSAVRWRERLAGWLCQLGWHGAAFKVKPGTRVNGPVLP
jgi:hypothetical protein